MALLNDAIGAEQGYIYVRLEYPLAVQNLRNAIRQAQEVRRSLKVAESGLAELEAVFRSMTDGLILCDGEGCIRGFNPAAFLFRVAHGTEGARGMEGGRGWGSLIQGEATYRGEAVKEAWVKLDQWSKEIVTAALEAGADLGHGKLTLPR